MPEPILWLVFGLVLIFGGTAFLGAPYVPSRRRDVRRAFDKLYRLKADDLLVDIGSGDGVVLRQAANAQAKAVGYEINPVLVIISRWLSRKHRNVRVCLANFWHSQLPDETTVVYLFGDGRDIKRMDNWLQKQTDMLARPLMVISYGFSLPDRQVLRKEGAHYLYQINPLHPREP